MSDTFFTVIESRGDKFVRRVCMQRAGRSTGGIVAVRRLLIASKTYFTVLTFEFAPALIEKLPSKGLRENHSALSPRHPDRGLAHRDGGHRIPLCGDLSGHPAQAKSTPPPHPG